jgi:hypothetical protein
LKSRLGGRSRAGYDAMAINMSFVLHEASTSHAVQRAIQTSTHNHTGQMARIIRDGDPDLDVTLWLAPSIGTTSAIATALNTDKVILQVDSGTGSTREVRFFGAHAPLSLPGSEQQQVGIAALVTRPGRRSSLLITRGPFRWPSQEQEVLRQLEIIIQAHAEQWQPAAQLWPAGAETLLQDELLNQ